MTQDEIKALIEDLRLNHEFCPKEVILQAADELEKQCTWVELTNQERSECWETIPELAMKKVEAKLKEKNT